MRTLTYIAVLLFLFTSCQKVEKSTETTTNEMSLGETTMKTYCFACHNPRTPDENQLIAPPLAGVKFQYKQQYPDKEAFVKAMVAYVSDPENGTTLIPGAVKRFGRMPSTFLKDFEIQAIVEYIYDNKIEMPTWFPEHFEKMHGTPLE